MLPSSSLTNSLVGAVSLSNFFNGMTTFWLLTGSLLCLTELLMPTAFVALMMGISSFTIAFVCYLFSPPLALQVVLWLGISTGLVFWSRRLIPKSKPSSLRDATEGRTLSEILPGQTGRVLYEGGSWQARCEDYKLTIAANQKVYVLRREGTTLIVMPESLLHS